MATKYAFSLEVKPEFQIIGGGLMGLSTAYALLKRGASVRIIEAREGVALETSFANAGMVHASLADPWNGPGVGRQMLGSLFGRPSPMTLRLGALPSMAGWGLKFLKYSTTARHWQATMSNYKLAEYSSGLIRKWRKELSVQDDCQDLGLLKIFRDEATFTKAGALTSKLQELGLKAERLSGNEAAKKEPCLAPIANNIVGAIYYPNDYKADAYIFCQALEGEILKLGGEILTGISAKSLLIEHGTVIGARTETTDLLADTTIVASGAYSTNLLRPLGTRLSLRPVKGYSLTFDNIINATGPSLPLVDDGLHCAVTPLGQSIRIAGTAEISGFNTSMTPKRLAPLLKMLGDIYPELAKNLSLSDGKIWHGFRPVSADGVPFIGKIKPGLAVNTGHGHMGWTMSAGSAEFLADLLLDIPASLDEHPFNPNRG